MNTIRLFVVLIEDKKSGESKVSQEGYRSIKLATEFVTTRSDSPVCKNPFLFESGSYKYIIYDVYAKD